MTLFFLSLLTTIRQNAREPGSEESNNSMIMHPLTVLQWWSLTWRNCHTHSTALTSLPVISGLTNISNFAYEDVNLRRAVLWAVRCIKVQTVSLKTIQKCFFPNGFPVYRKMCPGQWRVLWRSQLVITAKVSRIFKARSCCHYLKNAPRKYLEYLKYQRTAEKNNNTITCSQEGILN